jgi:hypothetical protein
MAKRIPDPTRITTTPAPEQMTMYVHSPTQSFRNGAGALPGSTMATRPMVFPSIVGGSL